MMSAMECWLYSVRSHSSAAGLRPPWHLEPKLHNFLPLQHLFVITFIIFSITMVLKLRLARIRTPGGAKRHKPMYNIVLAHARTARDSKPLEVLGTYNPIPQLSVGAGPEDRKVKDIKVDVSRAKYWLGVGAQPSDTVWRILSMVGVHPVPYWTGLDTTLDAVHWEYG